MKDTEKMHFPPDLMKIIVERGIKSVKKHETGEKRRGGIKGFEKCLRIKTMAELEQLMDTRSNKEARMALGSDHTKKFREKYWEHRYFTLQLEHVHKIMKVLFRYPMVSARAVIETDRILKIYNKKKKD